MLHKFITRSVGTLFLGGFVFAACGGDAGSSTPQAQYCTQLCDCNKCSDAEQASCLDDSINLEDDARSKKCGDSYDAYLTCLTKDASCSDGLYDDSTCFNEETDLKSCVNPPPACASTNDGICDDPAPAGTGKCAKGADATDCAVKPCPTVNNGECDEPKGTNTCDLGSDPVDCAPQPCPYANDGTCDEPGGTGACEPGSDPADCYCATANNGICDESQGTGKCGDGTDTVDCTPCVTCSEFADSGEGKLCPSSQVLYDAVDTCTCTQTCVNICSDDYCVGLEPGAECGNCITTNCIEQLDACYNDF